MKKICSSCGKYIDNNVNFCPHCGYAITSWQINKNLQNHNKQKTSPQNKNKSAEPDGCAMAFMFIIFGIIMLFYNTKGSIRELFTHIPYQQNIWCGTYQYSTGNVRILAQDIEKGGSSICMAKSSWKDDEYIEIGKNNSYDIYNDEIFIFEGKIKDGTFVNVKNITKWQGGTLYKK